MPRAKADPKPIARLVWVLAGEVTIDAPGPNSSAAQSFITELEARRALTALDVAGVSTVVSLAMAVDSMPGDARLWAQYRQATDALRGLDRSTEEDDDWTAPAATPPAPVRATPVRNAKKSGPADAGRAGRGRKQPAGKAADAAPAARVGRRPRAAT